MEIFTRQNLFPPLVFSAIIATLLAGPVTFVILRIYRWYVIRLMGQRIQHVEDTPLVDSASAPPHSEITPEYAFTSESKNFSSSSTRDLYRRMRNLSWLTGGIYAAGWFGAVLLMLTVFIVMYYFSFKAVHQIVRPVDLRYILVFWMFLSVPLIFPSIWVIALVSSRNWFTKALIWGVYFSISIVWMPALEIASEHAFSFSELFLFWLLFFLFPMLLVMGLQYRGMQGVGPLVYLLIFINALLPLLLFFMWISSAQLVETSALFCITFPVIIFCSLFIGGGILLFLKFLYQRKLISETSLMIDSLWLIFGILFIFLVYSTPYTSFPVALISIPICFILYKAFTSICFRLMAYLNRKRVKDAPELLFLRVFSLGKRSENLYGAISKAWRYIGSIRLITGPDLVTSTVGPHNFLDFLTGRLRRNFIDCADTLERRLAQIDCAPDLDGVFRANEFFCYDNTWRMVLTRLASDNVLVLLDLRQFSPKNKGCIYEITELINLIPLHKILFVVDPTTDRAFLQQTVQGAWSSMHVTSPNQQIKSPQLHLFYYLGKRSEYNHLLQTLAQMAEISLSSLEQRPI